MLLNDMLDMLFNDNPICKTEKEAQIYRTDFGTLWGEGGMF